MSTYHQLSAISRLLANLHPLSLFQDPPPTLNAPRIPIAEGNGGIRWADISDPNVPIQVLITAYPSMRIADKVELFWNNRLIDTQLVNQDHLDLGSMTLNVPTAAVQDGTPPVHYLVTSAVGGNVYKSHPLNIRVKTNVPGGTDPDPSTPYTNENLQAVTGVPELVEDSNADNIVATVPAYLNMTEGDQLKLSWGGESVEHSVQASEVNTAILLPVPRAVIEQAGAGPVLVLYEVRDIVNNWSLWSRPVEINAEIGSGLLRAPDVLDAVNGAIDLERLGDQDARIRVRVDAGMAEGDTLTVTWRARPPIGDPVEHEQAYSVDADNEGLPAEVGVPNAIARASAGGMAVITYKVTSNRGVQHSRRTSVEIIGQVQRLVPPTLQEAVGDSLDLEQIPDGGATVEVAPYLNMQAGDRVELFCVGTAANGLPSSYQDTRDITGSMVGKPVLLSVPKAFFTPLLNGSLRVYYRVKGEESTSLELNVVGQGGAVLPAPSVVGVVDGTLDPDAVPSGTNATVPQYPGKALGDRITLTWQGLTGTSYSDYIDVSAENLGTPINFFIGYTPYIIGNLNNDVTVGYRVQRSSGSPASSALLNLPIRRKAQDNFIAPTVVQAPGGILDPITASAGATVRVEYEAMLTTDTLAVAWTGEGSADTIETEQKPGSISGRVDFTIPPSVVAASQGKTINVRYAVVRGSNPVLSEPLALRVNTLQPIHLPTPIVPEANGTATLDMASFDGDAAVTVEPWPLIAEGQRYWIKVSGTLENGTSYSFYPARALLVSAGEATQGLSSKVLRTELVKLKHDSSLSVEVSVAFDGAADESKALTFPILTLTLSKLPDLSLEKPVIPSAPGNVLTPEQVPASGLVINVRSYTGMTIGDKVGVKFGAYTTQQQTVTQIQQLTFNVPKAEVNRYAGMTFSVAYVVTRVSGDQVTSPSVILQVKALQPALYIDPTPVTLNGRIYRSSRPVTNPPANASVTRTASGGKPPYKYYSSNPNAFEVDINTGRAISFLSGTHNVVVQDAEMNTAQYSVTVSNVRLFSGLGIFGTWVSCRDSAASYGGTLPTLAEWAALRTSYSDGNPGFEGANCWCLDSAGTNRRYVFNPATGEQGSLRGGNWIGDSAIGYGIFDR